MRFLPAAFYYITILTIDGVPSVELVNPGIRADEFVESIGSISFYQNLLSESRVD